MFSDLFHQLLLWLGNPILVFEALLIAAYAVLIMGEAGWSRLRGLGLYAPGETVLNVILYIGFFGINVVWAYFVFQSYRWAFDHRVLNLSAGGFHYGIHRWWDWALLFLFDDMVFYWHHRLLHGVRLLWTSHITHHSSTFFNLSAAFRQTWLPFFALPFWIVLPWIGFDPFMVMLVQLISLFWQVSLHTQVVPKLGPLEWIFVTPSHHRVHHGANAPYLNRNFGGILIIWDRLFGTFQAEDERVPVRYGLVQNIQSLNPLKHAFGEFSAWLRDLLSSRSVREASAYTFASPGWRPPRQPTRA
ncbi:MAG: sterol desaturase family protein [Nevskiales bacterium]